MRSSHATYGGLACANIGAEVSLLDREWSRFSEQANGHLSMCPQWLNQKTVDLGQSVAKTASEGQEHAALDLQDGGWTKPDR
jgi:hypothetical protein